MIDETGPSHTGVLRWIHPDRIAGLHHHLDGGGGNIRGRHVSSALHPTVLDRRRESRQRSTPCGKLVFRRRLERHRCFGRRRRYPPHLRPQPFGPADHHDLDRRIRHPPQRRLQRHRRRTPTGLRQQRNTPDHGQPGGGEFHQLHPLWEHPAAEC